MSGTSLDGLDICACQFEQTTTKYSYKIIASQTFKFPKALKAKLNKCRFLSGYELKLLDIELGNFIGHCVKEFQNYYSIEIDWLASHGHTVFHEPENKLTMQIGSGAEIFAQTNIPCINDFRSIDVALGGQGAPLVPIGDRLLFNDYVSCVNLGGISNISFVNNDKTSAFDISACNIILNKLSNKLGFEYDKNGELGKQGNLNKSLFEKLNQHDFFDRPGPKSLGIEWIEKHQFPLIENSELGISEILTTCYHHIAYQIAKHIKSNKVLFTGGGAHNKFLIELIEIYSKHSFTKAPCELIDFKEAIVFAFLGYLKVNHKTNCLSSVTGAIRDNIGGTIHGAI